MKSSDSCSPSGHLFHSTHPLTVRKGAHWEKWIRYNSKPRGSTLPYPYASPDIAAARVLKTWYWLLAWNASISLPLTSFPGTWLM